MKKANTVSRYPGIVDYDEKNRIYGIRFPDMPGTVSVGKSLDELYENAQEALRMMADAEAQFGRDVPVPSSINSVRDVMESTDMCVMPVPLYRTDRRPVKISVSLEAADLMVIDSGAKAFGLTRSAFLVEAARRAIK
ncbi:MAG: type II toxin-antitoxin system HicB family antitoxin [Methylobacteriaceae bacterium]|jgi:predicted RNase H-like HicB family nuclease|nr:type II toxin-antitoxin system HicB family antitoxin [Methylobacteriaceae bacterium]